jgi:hypothetical protein
VTIANATVMCVRDVAVAMSKVSAPPG